MAVQVREFACRGFIHLLQKGRRIQQRSGDFPRVGKGRNRPGDGLFGLDQRFLGFGIQPRNAGKGGKRRWQVVEDRGFFSIGGVREFEMKRPEFLRPLRPVPHSLRGMVIT